MNFEKLPPVPKIEQLVEIAFKKAREKGRAKNLKGNWLQKIIDSFPRDDALSEFYQKLMKLTLDFTLYKRSLGAVNWAIKRLQILHKNTVRTIIKEKDRTQTKEFLRSYYGRLVSTLEQIRPNMEYLITARTIMRSYPDLKEMTTVVLYGFPNVGKTTLLNDLTGTTAKVDSYAFTTKSINIGYIDTEWGKVQIADVPGTLARTKLNPIEAQAELVLEEADFIVFVMDKSGTSGVSIEDQETLWKRTEKRKKTHLFLSKQDLLKEKGESLVSLHARISKLLEDQPVLP